MKPKKPPYVPPMHARPAEALKRLIVERSTSDAYIGLPTALQPNLEPLRAHRSLELINAIIAKEKAIELARAYLSPKVQDEVLPTLEADLAKLKAEHEELLNGR